MQENQQMSAVRSPLNPTSSLPSEPSFRPESSPLRKALSVHNSNREGLEDKARFFSRLQHSDDEPVKRRYPNRAVALWKTAPSLSGDGFDEIVEDSDILRIRPDLQMKAMRRRLISNFKHEEMNDWLERNCPLFHKQKSGRSLTEDEIGTLKGLKGIAARSVAAKVSEFARQDVWDMAKEATEKLREDILAVDAWSHYSGRSKPQCVVRSATELEKFAWQPDLEIEEVSEETLTIDDTGSTPEVEPVQRPVGAEEETDTHPLEEHSSGASEEISSEQFSPARRAAATEKHFRPLDEPLAVVIEKMKRFAMIQSAREPRFRDRFEREAAASEFANKTLEKLHNPGSRFVKGQDEREAAAYTEQGRGYGWLRAKWLGFKKDLFAKRASSEEHETALAIEAWEQLLIVGEVQEPPTVHGSLREMKRRARVEVEAMERFALMRAAQKTRDQDFIDKQLELLQDERYDPRDRQSMENLTGTHRNTLSSQLKRIRERSFIEPQRSKGTNKLLFFPALNPLQGPVKRDRAA